MKRMEHVGNGLWKSKTLKKCNMEKYNMKILQPDDDDDDDENLDRAHYSAQLDNESTLTDHTLVIDQVASKYQIDCVNKTCKKSLKQKSEHHHQYPILA